MVAKRKVAGSDVDHKSYEGTYLNDVNFSMFLAQRVAFAGCISRTLEALDPRGSESQKIIYRNLGEKKKLFLPHDQKY